MSLQRIENIDVRGKRVFLRFDADSMHDGRGLFLPNTALINLKDSLRPLLDRGARIILATHCGSIGAKSDPRVKLDGLADVLGSSLGFEIPMLNLAVAQEQMQKHEDRDVFLLENLLNHPGEAGKKSDFSNKLALLADIYINDAFDASRFDIASITQLPKLLPAFAGPNLFREIEAFRNLLAPDKHPIVAVIGGVDPAAKLQLMQALFKKHLNHVLIAGSIAYTLMKSRVMPVGNSLCDLGLQVDAFQIIEKAGLSHVDLQLPIDHRIAEKPDEKSKTRVVGRMHITDSWHGVDIGPKTLSAFEKILKKAGAILWYGPLGIAEIPQFARQSEAMAKILSRSKAMRVIMGSSTIAVVEQSGLGTKVGHISQSSATAVEILSGNIPAGLIILEK